MRFALLFSGFGLLICFAPLNADRVVLKNGTRFEDVRTVPQGSTATFVVFSDGRLQRVDNAQIASIDIVAVSWNSGMSQAQIDSLIRKATDEAVEKTKKEEGEKQREQQEAQRQVSKEQLRGSLWRSFILPGWAQIHRGDNKRGYVFLGLTGAVCSSYYASRQSFQTAQKQYDNVIEPVFLATQGQPGILLNIINLRSRRQKLVRRERATNQRVALLGLVYLANITDALYFAIDLSDSPSRTSYHPPESVATAKFEVRF